ncbi:MAG: isoprenyl transferase [Candidatus Borkfalkiaceae bacterium]|nr:isoprenyl transferase [Christensenellaceae bacterium]
MPTEEVKIPRHLGIIMDGNGRWAEKRNKPRSFGHRAGSANVDRIVTHAFNRGVKTLSLFAFSCENWTRPEKEVNELMRLLEKYFKKFISKVLEKNVKLSVMGDVSVLSDKLKKIISDATERSAKNDGFVLNIGINYGGRQEIVRAVKDILAEGGEVSVDNISAHLYTSDFGEPDMIIRTGGELRISNFMLFQSAYSELYFTDVLWPDFDEKELDKAIAEYGERHRRFGGV